MKHLFRVVVRVVAALSILAVCSVVVFVVLTSWKAPIHQFNLWKLEKNFREVEHPVHSKLLTRLTGFGNLFRGASNGCDYLVGELRVNGNSQKDTARFYQNLSIRPFDDSERVPLEIKFFDDKEFSGDYLWSRLWSDWYEKIRKSFNWPGIQGTPYVVFARQTDYPPYDDIRCFYEPAIH